MCDVTQDVDEYLESTEGVRPEENDNLPLLNTQFNMETGKSKIVKTSRWGALSKALLATRFGLKIGALTSASAASAEKHETERSEKSLVHPALAIEDDDDGKCEKAKKAKSAGGAAKQ